jgi:type IV secretion system protein VirB9
VACIFNKSYDPNGVANKTGTTSPGIQRVIKGN